ncbi:hypothetical protein DKG75_12640 [Zavarzinia compransoris]|uniref:Uncharacterized protein n=1 Tax=Zavarzinia compransoris TaxID=1264899 RepID=A0A317E626_9PROT|nr:hypothetical protein DKG75_12640 [Zavarzinia compransoris]
MPVILSIARRQGNRWQDRVLTLLAFCHQGAARQHGREGRLRASIAAPAAVLALVTRPLVVTRAAQDGFGLWGAMVSPVAVFLLPALAATGAPVRRLRPPAPVIVSIARQKGNRWQDRTLARRTFCHQGAMRPGEREGRLGPPIAVLAGSCRFLGAALWPGPFGGRAGSGDEAPWWL